MIHGWLTAAAAMLAVGVTAADDAITMQEKATPGMQRHHRVTLTVSGKMATEKGEQPLAGQAALQYPERVIEVDADGVPKKVLRYYAGARAKIKRSDFGMKAALGMIGDDVELVIEIEGREHQN